VADDEDEAPGWNAITYGMTELFGKDFDDSQVSGWGHELTMRVPRNAEQPPDWRQSRRVRPTRVRRALTPMSA
jgi:hypothetical protein